MPERTTALLDASFTVHRDLHLEQQHRLSDDRDHELVLCRLLDRLDQPHVAQFLENGDELINRHAVEKLGKETGERRQSRGTPTTRARRRTLEGPVSRAPSTQAPTSPHRNSTPAALRPSTAGAPSSSSRDVQPRRSGGNWSRACGVETPPPAWAGPQPQQRSAEPAAYLTAYRGCFWTRLADMCGPAADARLICSQRGVVAGRRDHAIERPLTSRRPWRLRRGFGRRRRHRRCQKCGALARYRSAG